MGVFPHAGVFLALPETYQADIDFYFWAFEVEEGIVLETRVGLTVELLC